jgi:hypothetical protein
MAKVSSIMAQREALVEEVKRVQAAMAVQEARMREAVERMEVSAAARGPGCVPAWACMRWP